MGWLCNASSKADWIIAGSMPQQDSVAAQVFELGDSPECLF